MSTPRNPISPLCGPLQAAALAFVLLAAAVAIAASPAAAESLAGSRPNIVVVITDDQGYPPVGRHGHPWIRTPHLDRLHDSSTRFERFLVSPSCAPTRAALMTGRHPFKNGVTHTILERERLTLGATTLAEVLREAGYATGIFGKWHLGDEEPYQPYNRGFGESFIHGAGGIGQAYDSSCADAPDNSYFDPVVNHNGAFVKTRGFCTDVFFRAGLGWIRRMQEEGAPFFAFISTNAPHAPFIAPPENTKRFTDRGFGENAAGFYGMIENIDENMGLLLDKLEEWDLLGETLVVFMSDNGMTGGGSGNREGLPGVDETGSPMSYYDAGMRGLKGSVHEGGVRVPFFVRWDGRIPAGRSVEAVAAHIDFLPTLAELAGADPPPGQVEGRSLLPLLADPGADWPERYLYYHLGRWPKDADPDEHQWRRWAVRSHRYRLVEGMLFDMLEDPGEENDIAGEHPGVVADMKEAFDAFWKEARPLMVNEDVPLSPVRPYHALYERQLREGGIPEWEAPEL